MRGRLASAVHHRLVSFLHSRPHVFGGPPSRVTVDRSAIVNDALLNVASGTIEIREHVFFGHGVMLLTGTHDTGLRGAERQTAIPTEGRDIVIETGAWVASGAVVMGPCRVGANSVVAAGAVVIADVAPGATVGGIPARPLGAREHCSNDLSTRGLACPEPP